MKTNGIVLLTFIFLTQMDTALATDYEKLTELEQAIAAEQSNQESILDRLVETETELDEMQEKTV